LSVLRLVLVIAIEPTDDGMGVIRIVLFNAHLLARFAAWARLSPPVHDVKCARHAGVEYCAGSDSMVTPQGRSPHTQLIVLRFDAATHRATAWVGDTQVVEHEGGYTPFEADVTQVRPAKRRG
jgi:hypothetical protein